MAPSSNQNTFLKKHPTQSPEEILLLQI